MTVLTKLTREDIHVVALAGVQSASVVGLFGEGRTGGKDDLPVSPFDSFVVFALGQLDGIR